MAVIGYATLNVIPSFAGITGRLTAGLVGPAAAAGLTAGRQAGTGFSKGLSTAAGKMTEVGKTMTTAVSVPVAALGVTAIKMSGDFEAAMNAVRAVTGASGAELQSMTEIAKELGATTKFSATDAANALEFLGMAGFSAADATAALPGVLDLAASSGMDLARTADIASNILTGFGLSVDEMGRAGDVLAKTVTSANVDMEMLGESFSYVAPTASAAGMSIEEAAAAIGILGNAGVQGSMAGTALNTAISRLLNPTGAAAKTLAELGVETVDSAGKMRGLADILEDLEAGGADVTDMITIFGLEAGPKLQALLSAGSDELRTLTGELENAEGSAKKMAEIRMEGFKGGLDELTSAFEGLMIAIGDSGLLEWATSAIRWLGDLVTQMSQTNPELLRWGVIIGGIAIVAGPTIMVIGKLITSAMTVGRTVATAAIGIGKFGLALGKGLATISTLIGRLSLLAGRYALVGTRVAVTATKVAAFRLAGIASQAATAAASLTRLAGAYLMVGVRAAAAATKIVLVKTAQVAIRAATIAWTAVQWALNVALNANPIGLIVLAIAALVAGFIWAYNESETFRNIVDGALTAVGAVFTWLWENAIKPLWDGLVWLYDWVVANWQTILVVLTGPIGWAVALIIGYWDEIKNWFQIGIDFVVGVVEGGIDGVLVAWEWLSALPGKIAGWFEDAYNWSVEQLDKLVSWVSGIPDSIADGLSNLYSYFTAPFKSAFNAVAVLWNDTIGSWSITVPDWVPGIGGSVWSMPKIPLLADGGIIPATPGGILAVIGEGGEDEAVLPLSRLDAILASRQQQGGGAGMNVGNVTVNAWSDRFSLDQVQRELGDHGAV